MYNFLLFMLITCPPHNAEILCNGECICICIDGKKLECITGPFDNMQVVEVEK